MVRVITIDGPAGSGKSTLGRALAKRLGFLYLDTGAMYRGAALAAARAGIGPDDAKALGRLCRALDLRFDPAAGCPRMLLGEEDISVAIRTPEMDMLSSRLSAVPEVRAAMTELQRNMAKGICVVAEGRDMGTIVFPDADFKFFLTASPAVRAERRYVERLRRGETVTREGVERELAERDHQDRTRALAPLKPADDAKLIDSTGLSLEQVFEGMLAHVRLGQHACNP